MKWFKKKSSPSFVGPVASLEGFADLLAIVDGIRSQSALRGTFYRCVDLRAHGIAEAIAQGHVYRRVDGGLGVVEDDHPWQRLFYRPNPQMSSYMLWHWVATARDTVGAALLYIERGGLGVPRALRPIYPEWGNLRIILDEAGLIKGYEFYRRRDGKLIRLKKEDVVDLSRFDPLDPTRFYSLVDALKYELESDTLNHAARANYLNRGGTSPLYIFIDRPVSKAIRKELEESFRENFTGFRNVTRVPVLSGAEIRSVSVSSRDMEYVASVDTLSGHIMRVCGVPSVLFAAGASRENAEAARAVFYQNTVMPEASLIAEQLTIQLEEAFGSEPNRLVVLPKSVVPEDALTRRRVDQLDVMIGVKSPNEIRTERGLEPYEGGDKYFMAANLVPIEASEMPATLTGRSVEAMSLEGFLPDLLDAIEADIQKMIQRRLEHVEFEEDGGEEVMLWVGLVGIAVAELADSAARAALDRAARAARDIAEIMGGAAKLSDEAALSALDNLLRLSRHSAETTTSEVSRRLMDRIKAGERLSADLVREVLKEVAPSRAAVWARSLATAATNASAVAIYKAMGAKGKMWNSLLDGRERLHHHKAHGQIRVIDEPFVVNGELLQFPGDSSLGASASNIANCRCFLLPAELKGV